MKSSRVTEIISASARTMQVATGRPGASAERHLAPPGMAATRATLRVAISQLADQFSGARPEKLLRPTVIDRAPWEIIPDKLTVYRVDFLLRRGARGDYPYELELRSGRAGRPYAGQAVPSGTRDWPSGRENSLCPRALGNPV